MSVDKLMSFIEKVAKKGKEEPTASDLRRGSDTLQADALARLRARLKKAKAPKIDEKPDVKVLEDTLKRPGKVAPDEGEPTMNKETPFERTLLVNKDGHWLNTPKKTHDTADKYKKRMEEAQDLRGWRKNPPNPPVPGPAAPEPKGITRGPMVARFAHRAGGNSDAVYNPRKSEEYAAAKRARLDKAQAAISGQKQKKAPAYKPWVTDESRKAFDINQRKLILDSRRTDASPPPKSSTYMQPSLRPGPVGDKQRATPSRPPVPTLSTMGAAAKGKANELLAKARPYFKKPYANEGQTPDKPVGNQPVKGKGKQDFAGFLASRAYVPKADGGAPETSKAGAMDERQQFITGARKVLTGIRDPSRAGLSYGGQSDKVRAAVWERKIGIAEKQDLKQFQHRDNWRINRYGKDLIGQDTNRMAYGDARKKGDPKAMAAASKKYNDGLRAVDAANKPRTPRTPKVKGPGQLAAVNLTPPPGPEAGGRMPLGTNPVQPKYKVPSVPEARAMTGSKVEQAGDFKVPRAVGTSYKGGLESLRQTVAQAKETRLAKEKANQGK